MRYLFIILIIFFAAFSTITAAAQDMLRFAFTAVVIREDMKLNTRLIRYIEKKIGIKTSLVYRKSYKEIDDLLNFREIEIGWVCGAPYVTDHKRFGLELLAVPKIRGKSIYFSLVIVPVGSRAKNLSDLEEQRYAFSDPLSNSGKVSPTYALARMGKTPKTFFKKYIYTYSHYESIHAVASGFVDGASIDSYIYEAAKRFDPETVSKTKVIEKFGPYGFPPLTIRRDINPEIKKRLQDILTGMINDPEGKNILNDYGFDSFVVPDDSLYDSIREMMKYIGIYS
ncbi:MAG: phosphate/phosphite/phosphonate ABC transporter substrate-binding protein [Nitrospirota bacterium]